MEYKLRFEDHKGNFLNEDHLILDPKDILVITIPAISNDRFIKNFQEDFKRAIESKGVIIITDDIKLRVLKFGEKGVDE